MNVLQDTVAAELVAELRSALHDLNNAMTPVLANAQLAQVMVETGGDAGQEVAGVVEGARRATEIVRRVQDVAHLLQNGCEDRS